MKAFLTAGAIVLMAFVCRGLHNLQELALAVDDEENEVQLVQSVSFEDADDAEETGDIFGTSAKRSEIEVVTNLAPEPWDSDEKYDSLRGQRVLRGALRTFRAGR